MQSITLSEIFLIFLRLGAIGFGGPIALVALMEQECSGRRKWLSLQEFNERYVFCKLLPGPIASQMAMWMGYHVRGRWGGLVAGFAFLIPAFCLILVLSISYGRLASLSAFTPIVHGMEAGTLVIIVESISRMFRPYIKELQAWCFLVVAAGLMLLVPRWEPVIILSGGLLMVCYHSKILARNRLLSVGIFPAATLFQLFMVHFKAGITVFGTGLAVIPVLQHEVVEVYHWMSTSEFLDGIAFGQITPGPVTISAVFVGYRTAGFLGGVLACLGMYGPGVILILFVMPMVYHQLNGRAFLASFQKGAIPTVIGCIGGASLLFFREIIVDVRLAIIVVILALITWRFHPPGWMVILLGSVLNFAWGGLAGLIVP